MNASAIYFKLTGISNKNTKALLSKTRLSDTVYIWHDSQGYDKTMVTFEIVKSHMLDYFIHFDYVMGARRALVARKMG